MSIFHNIFKKTSPHKSGYRAEIDGLRAFAVLSVVAFHTFPELLNGGFIGVDIFFVISGFLITSHIFEKLNEGNFSFIDFFGRRIRRIFPALILVIASSLAFGWFLLLDDEYAQLGKHAASAATFIINFILSAEVGYFDNAAETKPMLHLWSLAVEEQFYIIWPLCLWLAWKQKFNLLSITLLIAFISFSFNLYWLNIDLTQNFFLPFSRFWELLAGSILAWFFINKKDWIKTTTILNNIISLAGLALLVSGVIFINEDIPFPSAWTLIPVFGALLVIIAGSQAWLNRIFLMNPVAIWFGLISYPLYL